MRHTSAGDMVAPERIDTMREETECPECGSPMDSEDHVCEVCGYEVPPDGLDDPDLTKAREFDRQQRQDLQHGEHETEAPEEDGGRPEADDSRGPRRPTQPTRMRNAALDPHVPFGVELYTPEQSPDQYSAGKPAGPLRDRMRGMLGGIPWRAFKGMSPEQALEYATRVLGGKYSPEEIQDNINRMYHLGPYRTVRTDEVPGQQDYLAHTTVKTQDRKGNSHMRPKTRISLQARVASLPSPERLREMGWQVLATPNPNDLAETHLIEDGRQATDEPRNQRVVSDQAAPVTARRRSMQRRAMGESTQSTGVGPAETTPQFSEDSKGITEHHPTKTMPLQYPYKHDDTPQYSEDSKGISEHKPGKGNVGQGGGKLSPPAMITTPQYAEDAKGLTEHHPGGIPSDPTTQDASGASAAGKAPSTKDNSGVKVPGEDAKQQNHAKVITTRVWKDAAGRVIRREEIIEGDEPEAQVEQGDTENQDAQAEGDTGQQQAWSKIVRSADDELLDEDIPAEEGDEVAVDDGPVTVNLDVPIEVPTLTVSPETTMMAAFKLADLEIDLGMVEAATKYERVAELEGEGLERITARLDTLRQVKTAGLSKKKGSPLGARLPSLRQASVNGSAPEQQELPDEAVFG